MHVHSSITVDRVTEAVEAQFTSLDNPGFCIACGADADNCEPDAREYRCECCRQRAVYGAEQLLMMIGGL